jgi:endonuclease/exonuclease/phosphatase family metal-dependent hydrolase
MARRIVVSSGRVGRIVCFAPLLIAAACISRTPLPTGAESAPLTCRDVLAPDDGGPAAVTWIVRGDLEERRSLDAWCRGVGPAVYVRAAPIAGSTPRGPIALVSWNVNAGAGDLAALVRDLRAGRLSDGQPVGHFVLLLQEALRIDSIVPAPGADRAGARRLVRSAQPVDVVAFAREAELSLFYLPSMRNGLGAEESREDRGNAILSTLPLTELRALELPFVRQRRVVPVALLGGVDPGAAITVASVHLDPFVGLDRLWVLGAVTSRGRQARVVADALPAFGPLAIGGDFNTWRGAGEPAVAEMRRISDPAPWPAEPTFANGRVLDHLFFRLPAHLRGAYRRAPHTYGSDHFPLVGWIVASSLTVHLSPLTVNR